MPATGRPKLLGSEVSVGLPSYLCWQAAVISWVHVPSVLFNRPCEKVCFQSDFTALISFLHLFYCFLLSILYYFSLFPIISPSLPLIWPPGLLFCGWWALSHAWSFFFFCHQGLTDEVFFWNPMKAQKTMSRVCPCRATLTPTNEPFLCVVYSRY